MTMDKEVHILGGSENPFSFYWGDIKFFIHFHPGLGQGTPSSGGGDATQNADPLPTFRPGGAGHVAMLWDPLDKGLLREELLTQAYGTSPAVEMDVDVSSFIKSKGLHSLEAVRDEVKGIDAPFIVRVILQSDHDHEQ